MKNTCWDILVYIAIIFILVECLGPESLVLYLQSTHCDGVPWPCRRARSCSRTSTSLSMVLQKHLPAPTQVLKQSHTEWISIFSSKCTMEEWSTNTTGQSVCHHSYCQVSTSAMGLRDGNCGPVEATRSKNLGALGEIISVPSHVTSTLAVALQLAETFQSRTEGSGTGFHSLWAGISSWLQSRGEVQLYSHLYLRQCIFIFFSPTSVF